MQMRERFVVIPLPHSGFSQETQPPNDLALCSGSADSFYSFFKIAGGGFQLILFLCPPAKVDQADAEQPLKPESPAHGNGAENVGFSLRILFQPDHEFAHAEKGSTKFGFLARRFGEFEVTQKPLIRLLVIADFVGDDSQTVGDAGDFSVDAELRENLKGTTLILF